MHAEVEAKFREFSEPLEGHVNSMYVDVKGLVTTGMGNLIDPMPQALLLPWVHESTGARATQAEVIAAWTQLKNQAAKFAKLHWKYAAKLNDLRLTEDAITELCKQRLRGNVAILRKAFPGWDSFPSDGQLGILSIAWAVGAGFTRTFTNFTRLVNAGDWAGTIVDNGQGYAAKIRETNNPGIVPRNARNRVCFANAATVAKHDLPVSVLHWPNVAIPLAEQSAEEERAQAAKAEADAALDRFVREEFERVRRGFSAGAALRQFETEES